MERPGLVVIIPAYNEAPTIADIVRRAVAFGDVIVVDDCSRDDTVERSAKAGATVVSNAVNLGYDRTLEHGFREAERRGFDAAVTMDADGEHDPETLAQFRDLLINQGYALVIGRRPRKRRLAESIMGFYMRQRYGVSDILCGMKGYHLRLFRDNGGFDHVSSIGTELAISSIKRGTKFREVAVPGRRRSETPRFGSGLKANWKIFRALYRVERMDDAALGPGEPGRSFHPGLK